MSSSRVRFGAFGLLAASLFVTGSLCAQATRTWVSGVGDDVNPCSRTAPCKTFAGAISKTAAGGEISVLDPGGFGAVTITKAITINGEGTLAGILSALTNGIVVNAGATDVVKIRNVSINGAGTGLNGIRFLAGQELHVEKCTIEAVTTHGIDMNVTGSSRLFVRNTNFDRIANSGISAVATGAGQAVVSVEGISVQGVGQFGIRVQNQARLLARNSNFANRTSAGISTESAGGNAFSMIENCTFIGNNNAIQAGPGAVSVRISNNSVYLNTVGLFLNGGSITSFSNNKVVDNNTDGNPTGPVAPK